MAVIATPHASTRWAGQPAITDQDSFRAPLPTAARVSIVLPAFNEEAGIAAVLDGLRPIMDSTHEIIVVDDGSSDRTAAVAASAGARVIRHDVNRGKGAALLTGFGAARGTILVTLDADGTYPPEGIPRLVASLDAGTDLVVGVRHGTGSMSPVNRVGNLMFKVAISAAARRRVRDPLSGMYAMRRELVHAMGLESKGFGIETEIIIKAARLGARLTEIDIVYGERIGESKLEPWRDGLIISRTIRRLMFRSMRASNADVTNASPH